MPETLPDRAMLRHDAASLRVELDDRQAGQLLEFGALLLRWNRAFNLVSRKDQDRLYHRHLLDSLSIAPWLLRRRVLDIGTGAGLPGIPLAIASPHRAFTLIDRNERKIRLVRQAARTLDLGNVDAVCCDVAELSARAESERFDTVVMRAVVGSAEAWRLASGALADRGRLLVMAHGQRAPGSDSGIDEVPPEAHVAAREWLSIPGLRHPHELLVIERAYRAGAESNDQNG